MNLAIFCQSLRSCWNHGNAHFLRGVTSALLARGHNVRVFEPYDSWSRINLVKNHGEQAQDLYHHLYPDLHSTVYDPDSFDLDRALDNVDLVLVHEWNSPQMVARIGNIRARMKNFRLLFHDTHHRTVTAPEEMASYDLRHYDGVLAFGEVIQDIYLSKGWIGHAWVWHEAADIRRFQPLTASTDRSGMIWIGNWGDDERSRELYDFLLTPVCRAGIAARIHGVRYPAGVLTAFEQMGIEFSGWLPNHQVPEAFARHRFTVHVPRRPYASVLPGIPTIRVFEALACGIPLICSPWNDCEGLFQTGTDFLMAKTSDEMTRLMRDLIHDDDLAQSLANSGLKTIRARHTCDHRVDELLNIGAGLGLDVSTIDVAQDVAQTVRGMDTEDIIDFFP